MINCICAIAKNEERYIKEWVDYHLWLGFDKIYIYDNNDINDYSLYAILAIPEYRDKVEIIDCRGKKGYQLDAYNDFIKNRRYNVDWAAFIDCDEFITLVGVNLYEFLNSNIFGNIILLNWMMYGTNGLKFYENKPVQLRFKRPKYPLDYDTNKHVKSIIRLNSTNGINCIFDNNPHCPTVPEDTSVSNALGLKILPYHHSEYVIHERAFIRHYYTKSLQEWREKVDRGTADEVNYHRAFDEYLDVED